MNNKNNNKYAWNDALILDKIQEILGSQNIDELELSIENLEFLKAELCKNTSLEEINETAFIVAENIDELRLYPNEDIKDYILRLKKYLSTATVKCIKAEFKGIEFEVHENSEIDDVFNDYYSKYDELYGISEMLSDLGLK